MALTEKTLELNVTHELLALGAGLWHIFWAAGPRRGSPRSPVSPPMYAAGLSLQEEKQKGWDVSIDVPSMGSAPARVAFLQFKLGEARTYSNASGTLFPRGAGATSHHVLFGINNNGSRNQHEKLRDTARGSGVPASGMYALPLLTDEVEVRRHLGDLIARTSFFTVPDIDATVPHDPIVTGTARKIAIAKSNLALREVRSTPKAFRAVDCGGHLLGELAAIRVHRAMSSWWIGADEDPRRTVARGRAIARDIVAYVASFLGVEIEIAEEAFGIRVTPRRTVRSSRGALRGDDSTGLEKLRRERLECIASHLAPFMATLQIGYWPPQTPALPDLKLFVSVPREGLRYRIGSDDHGSKVRLSYIAV